MAALGHKKSGIKSGIHCDGQLCVCMAFMLTVNEKVNEKSIHNPLGAWGD